jgi:hypothetical protein
MLILRQQSRRIVASVRVIPPCPIGGAAGAEENHRIAFSLHHQHDFPKIWDIVREKVPLKMLEILGENTPLCVYVIALSCSYTITQPQPPQTTSKTSSPEQRAVEQRAVSTLKITEDKFHV